MRRDRPACVAGFGGYPALPAMAAATLLRMPRLIHEQNGVLGRVNRMFARGSMWSPAASGRRSCPTGAQPRPYRQPGARARPGAGRRALSSARRPPDGASGDRRQPGRGSVLAGGARRRWRCSPGTARPAALVAAGPARGHGAGAGRLRRARTSTRICAASSTTCPSGCAAATLVISRAGREFDRRHHGDRPPGDPDPLRRMRRTITRPRTPPGSSRRAAPS